MGARSSKASKAATKSAAGGSRGAVTKSADNSKAVAGKERSTAKKSRGADRAAKDKARNRSGLSRLDDDLIYVLSHPLRVRILASLNKEEGSASDLAERLNCSVWNANYHLKKLAEYDCAEFVRHVRVGSVLKSIYRAKVEVNFPKEVWEGLPPAVQGMLIVAVFMTSFSDAEVALLDRAYEKRPESHASWTGMDLDPASWLKLVKLTNRTLVEAQKIKAEAAKRLERDPDSESLRVSLNMSAFVLPSDAEDPEARVSSEVVRKRVRNKSTLVHDSERA